jgi:hypothetical protein
LKKSEYTIRKLLKEVEERIPIVKEGMILETKSSIYPTLHSSSKECMNIMYKDKIFTKPLACTAKDKRNFIKDDSPISDFFLENTRGDFLKVVKIEGSKAKCINLSIKKEFLSKFYEDEYIIIDRKDLLYETVKPYKRKIDKFFKEK